MVSLLIWSSEPVKMGLPVSRIDRCVLDRVTTVDHLSVTGINPHMGHRFPGIVRSGKENNVPCPGLFRCYRRTDVVNSLCRQPSHVADSGIGKHIAYKPRT